MDLEGSGRSHVEVLSRGGGVPGGENRRNAVQENRCTCRESNLGCFNNSKELYIYANLFGAVRDCTIRSQQHYKIIIIITKSPYRVGTSSTSGVLTRAEREILRFCESSRWAPGTTQPVPGIKRPVL